MRVQSTKEAVKRAIELGAEIKYKGGEIILIFPGKKPLVTPHWKRRKDASRTLMMVLRDVEQEQEDARKPEGK